MDMLVCHGRARSCKLLIQTFSICAGDSVASDPKVLQVTGSGEITVSSGEYDPSTQHICHLRVQLQALCRHLDGSFWQ